jgi:hypothetical protein
MEADCGKHAARQERPQCVSTGIATLQTRGRDAEVERPPAGHPPQHLQRNSDVPEPSPQSWLGTHGETAGAVR